MINSTLRRISIRSEIESGVKYVPLRGALRRMINTAKNQYTVILQANNLETSILYHFLCYMKLYFVMYSLYIVQFFIYGIFLKDFVDLNHPIRMFIQCIIYIHTVKR